MTGEKTLIDKAFEFVNQGKVEEALGLISDNKTEYSAGKKEYLISKLYFKAGNFEKGVVYLEEAVQKNRSFSVLWEKIGDDLILLDKIEDALKAYERLYIEIPEKSEILLKIGECHIALNNPQKAIGIFEAYLKIYGDDEVALKRIAKANRML